MRAALLEKYGAPLNVTTVPDPHLSPTGAIIEVKACGICRSDWHIWNGDWAEMVAGLPIVGGHELSGVVAAVGKDVQSIAVGDRVVVPFTVADGTCSDCLDGNSNVCPNKRIPGTHHDGGFAELAHVDHADFNLVQLPEEVTFEQASGMGCRFMTSYHGVLDIAGTRPGEWVAIYGTGGVGLSAIQIATAAGANVIAVDIDDTKLALARQVGAVYTVNSQFVDPVEAIRDITGGGAHVSIDALGADQTLQSALVSVRAKGRVLQLGMTAAGGAGNIPIFVNHLILNEIAYLGSLGMPRSKFPLLVNQMRTGKLDPGELVTQTTSLSGIAQVFEDMSSFKGAGISLVTDFSR